MFGSLRRLRAWRWLAPATFAALGLASGVAGAAEITDVASSFDEDNPFDLRLRVGYEHMEKRASVYRETEGASGQQAINTQKDLLFSQHRDTLNVMAAVGLFQDLELWAGLPVVVSQSSELSYDTGNGVNAGNSTTVADGIIPAAGYDATQAGAGFASGSSLAFRGAQRYGLDSINFGLKWAPLSQRRDDTKPTWVIAAEADVSFGTVMKFDRMNPGANNGVSDGTHKFLFSTALSHRFKYIDPYISFWYLIPVTRGDSLYTDYGAAQQHKDPQQQAGTTFGFEGVPYDKNDFKVAIQIQARIQAHFEGRGYSELWEMLAGSSALGCTATATPGNPACDPAQSNNPYSGLPYTGLSVIQDYVSYGADVALLLQASKYFRLKAFFNYTRDNGHIATFDSVGDAGGGRVSDPSQYNPAYRPVIDEVGRRYYIDNIDNFTLGLYAQLMF